MLLYCYVLKKRIIWGDKHGETREKSAWLSCCFCHSVLLGVHELLDVHYPCWLVGKETYCNDPDPLLRVEWSIAIYENG